MVVESVHHFITVLTFGNDLDIFFAGQQAADSVSSQWLVIGYHNTDHERTPSRIGRTSGEMVSG